MNYDTMSVEELRNQYDILWLEEMVLKKLGTVEQLESLRADKELVFAAIKIAVIREASAGVVTTYTTLDGPEGNECIKTDWHIVGNYPEDDTFDLIPKVQP